GGWDPIPDDAHTAAAKARVLGPELLAPLKDFLSSIKPMPAVFDHSWVRRLDGRHVKSGTKRELANQLMQDIRAFMDKNKCSRAVMVWCASTEAYQEAGPQHQSLAAFEKALDANDPANFKTKEVSKLSVLEQILEPERYPALYKDLQHKVSIHYYKPRGDNKEGWDNIDIVGWMGYPMQIKVNFLCRDSILAAPIVLDLALFSDFAQRAGMKGIQEWLSFYYKSPMAAAGLEPEHDLFIQQTKLKNTLRHLMGEEQI